MLFLYNFGLNGQRNVWQYVHPILLDAFGHTIALNHTEICIFGRWYKFKLVSPD